MSNNRPQGRVQPRHAAKPMPKCGFSFDRETRRPVLEGRMPLLPAHALEPAAGYVDRELVNGDVVLFGDDDVA